MAFQNQVDQRPFVNRRVAVDSLTTAGDLSFIALVCTFLKPFSMKSQHCFTCQPQMHSIPLLVTCMKNLILLDIFLVLLGGFHTVMCSEPY